MLYGAIPRIDASVLSEILETFCTGCRNFAMLFLLSMGSYWVDAEVKERRKSHSKGKIHQFRSILSGQHATCLR